MNNSQLQIDEVIQYARAYGETVGSFYRNFLVFIQKFAESTGLVAGTLLKIFQENFPMVNN
jgi:hypothetical protein